MTLLRCIFLTAVLSILLPRVTRCGENGQAPASPPDTSRPFGLVFDAQAEGHPSSPGTVSRGGYSYSLGFGVNFSPRFQMAVRIYTGREEIRPGSVRPVDGGLPMGGASLEGTVFILTDRPLRPYGALACGLRTLNGGDGYNGWEAHGEAGVEWEFSRFLSLRGGAEYSVLRFHDPTGEAYQAAGFEPFTLRCLGVAVRLTFYPSITP